MTDGVAEILDLLVDSIGSSGSGTTIEIADTFADISGSGQRFVIVTADETNNGDKSLYLYDGTTLLFLQTIAP
jgi:hypothetical protein